MIRVKLSFLFLILSACVYAQEVINIDTTFNFKCTEVLKPVNNNNYRNLIKHSYNYGYAQLEVFNKAVYISLTFFLIPPYLLLVIVMIVMKCIK